MSSARDGQEALACLRLESGWVVLLDWMLPGLDGWQVLGRVQADPTLHTGTKVVVMSSAWRLAQEWQALESEVVVARLPKPFAPQAVLDLARRLASDAA